MKTIVVFVSMLFPLVALATTDDELEEKLCRQKGVNIWGASHHTERRNRYGERYNEKANWGLGARCYVRQNWFGNGNSRSFVQADFIVRNSYWGKLITAAAGTEFEVKRISEKCGLYIVGALTAANQNNRWTIKGHGCSAPSRD